MQIYNFMYAMDDGRSRSLKAKGKDIFDAVKKLEGFLKAMAKKEGWELKADSIAMFSVQVAPKRGRKAKSI